LYKIFAYALLAILATASAIHICDFISNQVRIYKEKSKESEIMK